MQNPPDQSSEWKHKVQHRDSWIMNSAMSCELLTTHKLRFTWEYYRNLWINKQKYSQTEIMFWLFLHCWMYHVSLYLFLKLAPCNVPFKAIYSDCSHHYYIIILYCAVLWGSNLAFYCTNVFVTFFFVVESCNKHITSLLYTKVLLWSQYRDFRHRSSLLWLWCSAALCWLNLTPKFT